MAGVAGTGSGRPAQRARRRAREPLRGSTVRQRLAAALHRRHAQLIPTYFREPNINIGVDGSRAAPHLVGAALLRHFNIAPGSIEAYAFHVLNSKKRRASTGKIGGFAHMATLVKKLRASRPGRTLLLDGGDTWQGSATALWTNGQDMVDAQNRLGVDMMTATGNSPTAIYASRKSSTNTKGRDRVPSPKTSSIPVSARSAVFKPYVIREVNQVKVAVIGQGFPTRRSRIIALPSLNWSFGTMMMKCRNR